MSQAIDAKTRKAVLTRDQHTCQKCGRRNGLECHHLQPRRRGGSNESDNLITLCTACHNEWDAAESGTHMTFDEWMDTPPYSALVALYRTVPSETRQAAYQTWQMFKGMRANEPIPDRAAILADQANHAP